MDPVQMASHMAATTATAEMWQYPMLGVAPPPPMLAARIGGRDAVTVDESAVMDRSGGGSRAGKKRRDLAAARSEEECSKLVSTSSGNELTDSETRRTKVMKGENGNSNTEAESSSGNFNQPTDQNAKPSEPTKQDYIHVRARRGEAADSHSLAERARREKISERMKILQDLVPGCNKVIGKASVLDEIINYIQALQRQVEFLSMKLEAVNSRMNSCMEGFSPKDFGAQTYDTAPSLAFSSQSREYEQGSAMDWLHMQVGGAIGRVT